MPDTARKLISNLLTSPEPVTPVPAGRKGKAIVGVAALAVGAWIFGFLMRRYFGLGTGGDMYVNVQLATSWLEGRFLQDRLFGNYLSVHTYFFSPLLAAFVYPFGAPGLLLATGLAAALGVVAVVRILRLFGVSSRVALVFAVLTNLMPLSLLVYQIDETGFQVELLIPCLSLWLAYFLLRRQWMGSLMLGLALQAVKEDAVLILVPVTVTVVCEDLFRSFGSAPTLPWGKKWNGPALTVGLISVLVTPLLLFLVKSQPAQDYQTLGSFAKVHATDHSPITGIGSLWRYVTDNLLVWLSSATVVRWLAAVLAGTWGLVILRPHLLIAGVLTTLTAWLVQTNLLWAPRFAPTLAFIQLVGCLGFVSVCQLLRKESRPVPNAVWRTRALVAGGVLILGAGWYGQYRLAPRCREVYTLSPTFEVEVSPAELRQADELFGRYRREAPPEEPVTASPYLFRYMHDRNFFWVTRLRGRPQPQWILWDQGYWPLETLWRYLRTDAGYDLPDYELVAQSGRFLLYRAWAGRSVPPAPAPLPVLGETDGMIRMKVQFAPGRAGASEPMLSLGAPRNGQLFFVHYVSDRKLLLGLDSVGVSVQRGPPVDYVPGQTYELELFSEALLSPPAGGAGPSPVAPNLLRYRNVVRVALAGQVVLGTFAPSHRVVPHEIFPGFNFVRSGSAVAAFSGKILEARRGGYPVLAEDEVQAFGPVRLEVRLPESAVEAAEPMVVAGVSGDATIGYVRLLADGRIRVGVDFWGFEAVESEPVAVDRARPVHLTFAFPVLFPPRGDPRWGGVDGAEQARLQSWLRLSVNGTVVVDRRVAVSIPRQPSVFIGENPAGGSVVTAKFSGEVLRVSREPFFPR